MAGCGFTSARTLIRWSITCLASVSVTTVRPCFTEDTTLLQPSPSLLPPLRPPFLPATDREDGFTKLTRLNATFRHMYASTLMCNILASWSCLVGFRNMFASTSWRIHAGWKLPKTQRDLICLGSVFICNFIVLASSSQDTSMIRNDLDELSGKTGSDIHVAIT